MIVVCRGQPRSVGLSVDADDEDVDFGLIRLPGLVRAISTAPKYELVTIPIRRRPLQRESDEARAWLVQRESFDERHGYGCGASQSRVGARVRVKRQDAADPVELASVASSAR